MVPHLSQSSLSDPGLPIFMSRAKVDTFVCVCKKPIYVLTKNKQWPGLQLKAKTTDLKAEENNAFLFAHPGSLASSSLSGDAAL